MHIDKQLMYYLKKYKVLLALLYLICILAQILGLIPVYLFGNIVDFIVEGNFNEVKKIVLKLIIIFIGLNFLNITRTLLTAHLSNKITNNIKENIFNKTINLPMQDFDQMKDGEVLSKLENDSLVISGFIINDISNLIVSVITILLTLGLILKLTFKLSIVAIVMFPISMITSSIVGKLMKKYTIKNRELTDTYFSFVQEFLTKFKEVRCLAIQDIILKDYVKLINDIAHNFIQISITNTISSFMSNLITSIGEWIIILYGAWLIINKYITIGIYVAFNSYLDKFSVALQQLFNINIHVQALKVSLARVHDLFEHNEEDFNETKKAEEIEGQIELNNISFSFKNSDVNILNNLSFVIPKNSFYVVVGSNGSGKTTLLNIISRLYKQTKGTILIDQNPIDDLNLKYLRENIAYIQQNSYVFNTTIKENLSIFNENIPMTKIIEACKMVGIHSYIESLPNQYNSIIGKEGINLSGGQKSKLVIARSILKNPKIMLLDEITSDLDPQSELEIMEVLDKLSSNHTILMVAHRISSVLSAQKIIVMDNGRAVGVDSHDKLMLSCEKYRSLFSNQINSLEEKILFSTITKPIKSGINELSPITAS